MEKEWNSVDISTMNADFLYPSCSIMEKPRDVVIEQDLNLHRAVRRLPIHTDIIPIDAFITKIMAEAEAEAEKKRKEKEESEKRYEEEKKRLEEEKEKEEEEKKKKEEEGERRREDIISNLPDNLLKKILSYLPIYQQARSRILSHRWNPICSQLWASNPVIRIFSAINDTLLCRVLPHMGNLKVIRLDNLRCKKDQIQALLLSTPLLEALMIHECTFLYGPVYLSHPTINKLRITSCSVDSLHQFFVVAHLPKLVSLRYNYSNNPPLHLHPATSLVEASLHSYHGSLCEQPERYLRLMRFMPHLRRLAITFEMFHYLVVGHPKYPNESFTDLEELFVGEFENLEELHLENGTITDAFCIALVTFINGNPSIQKLCLKVDAAKTTSWGFYGHSYSLDDRYPHLDTSPPFPNRQPFPLLLQLKRFRIIGSNGGKWGEIRLARLILKHAVVLESFNVICWCRDKDGIKRPTFNDDIRMWQIHDDQMLHLKTQKYYLCYWETLKAEMDEDIIIHKKHSDWQKGRSSEATVPITVVHRDIICPLHYDKDD